MKIECAECMKIVSVPTRFKIFEFIKHARKKITISNLVKLTSLRQPTVTFHVNKLEEAGLLKKHKVGRTVVCERTIVCAGCPLYT